MVIVVHIIGSVHVQMRDAHQNCLAGYDVSVAQDVEVERFLWLVQRVKDAAHKVSHLRFGERFVRLLDFLENADLFFKIGVRLFCDGRSLFRDHLDAGLDVLNAFCVGVVIQVGFPIDNKGNNLIFALQKGELAAVAADIVPDASCLIVKA